MILRKNFAMLNMDDLSKIESGQVKLTNEFRQSIDRGVNWLTKNMGCAKAGTDFSADPDGGSIGKRLSGDFKWAVDEINKMKNVASVGNVESLFPEVEFGHLAGTEVDFDQYLRHDPRCLGRVMSNVRSDGESVVRIAIGLGGSGFVQARELARRTAQVMRIAKQYEEAGYGVELFGMYATMTKKTNPYECGAVIVDCSRSSVGQAISCLTSTLVFRTLGFEVISAIGHSPNGSYPVWKQLNADRMPEIRTIVKRQLGNDTRIIFPGSTDEEIVKEIESGF